MPVTEVEVAITEFLGNHPPFRAVLKQSAEDFIVNEVQQNAHITSLTSLPDDRHHRNKRPAPPSPHKDQPPVIPTDDQYTSLDAILPTAATVVRTMLNTNANSTFLPSMSDKALRTKVHQWVREHLPTHISEHADTTNGPCIKLMTRSSVRPSKRRRADRGRDVPAGDTTVQSGLRIHRSTFVQFVLWKRGRDTNEALNALARLMNIPSAAFSYAGTKDKRAITTQLVTVRGIPEWKFAMANARLAGTDRQRHRPRSLVVGDIALAKNRALSLGDLLGNRFTLVLRDLQVDKEAHISAAVQSVREHGFVNYFGLQRFGSGISPTHETGFAVLRSDFKEVCRRLLLPVRAGEADGTMGSRRREMVEALDRFARNEIPAADLSAVLPMWMTVERTLAEAFREQEAQGRSKEKYDYAAAFGRLPRNLRRIYGHAVQSYLWNVMASERIRMCRPDVPEHMFAIEGDLILKEDKPGVEINYLTEVRSVTAEEAEQKTISVFSVVIPVVGSDVPVPDSHIGKAAREALDREGVNFNSKQTSEYGLKGTYRRLMAQPRDVEMKIVTYTDKAESLVPSGLEQLDFGDANSKKDTSQSNVKDKEVNGSTEPAGTKDTTAQPMKIECETEGTATKTNSADIPMGLKKEQDLDKSVEEGNEKVSVSIDGVYDQESACKDPTKVEGDDTEKTTSNDKAESNEREPLTPRKALVLSFTLGCAEYATMLVRQLTRNDSSTANQKAMQNAVSNT